MALYLGADAHHLGLALRPEQFEDDQFLLALYGSTRQSELDLTGWDAATKDQFVAMQFHAQRTYYRTHYSDASYDVVELNGRPVGRLYVRRHEDEIVLMDVALLPEYRSQGLGSRLLAALIDESVHTSRKLTLHVETNNPRAYAWYRRFGFEDVENNSLHVLMQRAPTRGPW